MKYGIKESNLTICSKYSNKEKSEDNKPSSYEEVKDNSKLDKSILPIKRWLSEKNNHHAQFVY